jgi:hypothetical protein
MWLRTGTRGGLLWTRQWTCGSRDFLLRSRCKFEMPGISRLADELSAYQCLCSMQLLLSNPPPRGKFGAASVCCIIEDKQEWKQRNAWRSEQAVLYFLISTWFQDTRINVMSATQKYALRDYTKRLRSSGHYMYRQVWHLNILSSVRPNSVCVFSHVQRLTDWIL